MIWQWIIGEMWLIWKACKSGTPQNDVLSLLSAKERELCLTHMNMKSISMKLNKFVEIINVTKLITNLSDYPSRCFYIYILGIKFHHFRRGLNGYCSLVLRYRSGMWWQCELSHVAAHFARNYCMCQVTAAPRTLNPTANHLSAGDSCWLLPTGCPDEQHTVYRRHNRVATTVEHLD